MLDRFSDPQERAEAVKRFGAESATLRSLNHPRIPRVYASFHDEGRHYLVMDFIRGEDLVQIVDREGAQPEARVLAWAADLCDVLGYLHDQEVIFRDLKPSNVMIEEPGGTLKLIDFGIAKVFQAQARGTQIGTPGYAPPEQYQGLATPVSDVYAFGATLHHLLTGRDPTKSPPFAYPPVRDLAPTVSARTAAAVAQAVQMRQEDRFQSIAELCAALAPEPAMVMPAPAPTVTVPAVAAPAPAPVAPAPVLAAPVSAPAAPASRPAAPIPAPAAAVSRPPAPSSAPQPAPAVPASTPAARTGRRSVAPLLIGAVLVLLLIGAGAALLLGQGLLPQPGAGPTATTQVLVAQIFVARDIEIVVSSGSTDEAVNQAFAAALLQLARLNCACEPQIQPGSLVYLNGGEPRQISIGQDGARYRASLQATILVPQP
jgi:serine/threonine-protein kinase